MSHSIGGFVLVIAASSAMILGFGPVYLMGTLHVI